jgi:hypothetical protein
MRALLNLLFFLFTAVAFLGSAFFVVAKLLSNINFSPDTKAWKDTLRRLRERVKQQAGDTLVAWDKEMFGLLSLNRINQKKGGWMDNTFSGTMTTIYHEPVLAYAGRKNGNTGVLVLQTSDREIILRQKGKETEIWVNSAPFGIFTDGVLLSAGRNGKMLAQWNPASEETQLPVLLGNNTAAAITNPEKASGPNPRVLTLLRDLTVEEENALLALAMIRILG